MEKISLQNENISSYQQLIFATITKKLGIEIEPEVFAHAGEETSWGQKRKIGKTTEGSEKPAAASTSNHTKLANYINANQRKGTKGNASKFSTPF